MEGMERALEWLTAKGCNYAEARYEKKYGYEISIVNGNVDEVGKSEEKGGSVRVFYNGGVGFSYSSNPNWLELAKNSWENSVYTISAQKFAKKSSTVRDSIIVPYEKDPLSIPIDQKIQVLMEYSKILGSNEKVEAHKVFYKDYIWEKWFYNTEGSQIYIKYVFAGVYMFVQTREGNVVEKMVESIGEWGGFEQVENLHEKAENLLKTAVDILKAETPESGRYKVIMDPFLTGVFTHEAFGHLSEADHIYETKKLKEIMTLGRRFGREILNIVDDGTLLPYRGYTPYDDEGVPARKTYLIKGGVLVGRLHSRKTAELMGEELTGNGRAIFSNYQPIVRMTNTFIEPQNYSLEDLMNMLDDGIYAIDYLGGETEMERFTFSAKYGYLIKGGKKVKMIKGFSLAGNVFETLYNISAIGNDLKIHGGMGGCGKAGQSPLPVGVGGPHILVDSILVTIPKHK